MTTVNEQILPPYYYYVDPDTTYQAQRPNPLDELISVYGLQDLSHQVARTNQDGTKAIKLRKSYKNQIQDLSGKFATIPTRENGKGGEISHILFQNNPDMVPQVRREPGMTDEQYNVAVTDRDRTLFESSDMDWDICKAVLSQFERSYPSEFQGQGFQVDDLAFDLDGTGKLNPKKRKVKSNGSSMATPNSDMQEDVKRRRLD